MEGYTVMLNAVNMARERNETVLREGNAVTKLMFLFLKTSYGWTLASTSSSTSNLLEFQIMLSFFFWFSSFAFLEFLCMLAPPFALVDT